MRLLLEMRISPLGSSFLSCWVACMDSASPGTGIHLSSSPATLLGSLGGQRLDGPSDQAIPLLKTCFVQVLVETCCMV